jgi:drug/metabolite transporter (DMT)-like permease
MPIAVDGGTQAFQRILGGLLCTVIGYAIIRAVRRNRTSDHKAVNWRKGSVLGVLNAAAGPTCGVACFQWALASQPAAIVLPIVATSPVVTIFLTWALDGLKPTRRAVIGGVVAVLGAAALAAARVAR